MRSLVIAKPKGMALIGAVKALADLHRDELGFHTRQAYADALQRRELIVAQDGDNVLGFVRFHRRRDGVATIYEIATEPGRRRRGVACRLVSSVVEDCRHHGIRVLRLSCPADLEANGFYEAIGFERASPRTSPGKARPLIEWRLPILPPRPLTFVASLSNSGNDLRHLIRIWEEERSTGRPFDRCIITPLFTDSSSIRHVRYIHDRWGVEVIFDSGGFFVQQGKVSYDELFPRLLDYYTRNDWAEYFVLPDSVVPSARFS